MDVRVLFDYGSLVNPTHDTLLDFGLTQCRFTVTRARCGTVLMVIENVEYPVVTLDDYWEDPVCVYNSYARACHCGNSVAIFRPELRYFDPDAAEAIYVMHRGCYLLLF
ncbi:hypothetical protein CRV159 [Nile crocodilepox virus]|uniref:Uncharacterized protein n=1 Tax=Nile crocodilepox virus (isolate Crocodylus niloticus/Zimbabwe/Ume/2001) TaxID=1289473 RepID=Q06ZZ2_CPRVZ|nr:hypothetical protein CRV159 [Nile crocodilepox virus]ABJ09050.1 hypothetical protein CRV159 [Nile crocodilepox virus]